MCSSGPRFEEPETTPAPTKREKTAVELSRPEEQRERQELAARFGTQLLRAPLVNPS